MPIATGKIISLARDHVWIAFAEMASVNMRLKPGAIRWAYPAASEHKRNTYA